MCPVINGEGERRAHGKDRARRRVKSDDGLVPGASVAGPVTGPIHQKLRRRPIRNGRGWKEDDPTPAGPCLGRSIGRDDRGGVVVHVVSHRAECADVKPPFLDDAPVRHQGLHRERVASKKKVMRPPLTVRMVDAPKVPGGRAMFMMVWPAFAATVRLLTSQVK